MIYINKKTGQKYELKMIGIDCTNEREGLRVAIYTSNNNTDDNVYVRSWKEFDEKFIAKYKACLCCKGAGTNEVFNHVKNENETLVCIPCEGTGELGEYDKNELIKEARICEYYEEGRCLVPPSGWNHAIKSYCRLEKEFRCCLNSEDWNSEEM